MIYVVLIILSFDNCSSKKPFGSMNTLRRELKANDVNIDVQQNGDLHTFNHFIIW